ncbi:MAG: hypothetical protein GW808_07435 [Sphingomonadales bacterium]|nr:hypothetical protein [Sphingomonadales bacterium]PIX65716.1 MAG: hypothetical protein COZ43_08980 [Sphingomonadales bacterium CG_4_10_14_3_um_filter_58_15]NCO49605.1 hypothetical protein [Sphingomonadales bacterium]NCP00279.1 hypothetical protein [Sphingomonadales bacterium]NCP26247.1 hypothetical protein [Sphingomonadales bacterium]
MTKLLFALPMAILLAAPAVGGETITLTEKQQSKLDKRLEGRTAGEPQSCIGPNDQRNMTVISDDILIFSSSSHAKTIYVNKPYLGCRNADRNILSYSRPTAQLCQGEAITLVDNTIGMSVGSCAFGEFVPYTKNAD